MRPKPVVAIDGPSGAGKSTVARELARALGFQFVDTGALYRTVALLADENGVEWSHGSRLAKLVDGHEFAFDSDGALYLDGRPVGEAVRSPRMSLGASEVAQHAAVREALLVIQRVIGKAGGVVLEGRDIGTVVFPDAEIKFFLDASVSERARRRFEELLERGRDVTLDQITREQEERDRSDRERELSPLRKADDAIEVPCDDMTAQQVVEHMLAIVKTQFSFD
jgi:cytidylate kinase